MKRITFLALSTLLTSFGYCQTSVVIGEGTGSGTYAPIASWYNSSATESLYTGNEIGISGNITQLAYQKASGNSDTEPMVKIYMKETNQTVIGADDYSIGDNDFAEYTLVYDGTIPNNVTSGWMEVTLQTPFSFSASQNLSILVTGTTCIESGRPQYRYTTSQGSKMSAGYDDGNIACEGDNPWTAASIMEPVWERPNIRFAFGTLSNKNFSAVNSKVYNENETLKCVSETVISEVVIYDCLGKEINALKEINNTEVLLQGVPRSNQLLLIKVTDVYGKTSNLKTIF